MNNILLKIFPESISNLIIRFNIHPVAEAFKRRIRIDEEEIQDIINFYNCTFSYAYFRNYSDMKQIENDRMNHYGELSD